MELIFILINCQLIFLVLVANVDGLVYFEDLMDESSLPSSINLLEKDYDSSIRDMDGLDERIFINDNDSLLCSSSLSGCALSTSGNGAKVSFFLKISIV